MKKMLLLFILGGLLVSCGTTKMERQSQRTFKGDWVLNDITYPGSTGFVDVTLFQDAKTNCFRGSQWHFIPNNNKGSYTLEKPDCNPGVRNFRWNVVEHKDSGFFSFTLKPEIQGVNDRKNKSGYRLDLVSLDQNQMVWEETVSYEGKPFTIRMSFIKR